MDQSSCGMIFHDQVSPTISTIRAKSGLPWWKIIPWTIRFLTSTRSIEEACVSPDPQYTTWANSDYNYYNIYLLLCIASVTSLFYRHKDQSSCVMISPDRISPAMTSTRAKVGHPCPNSSLCQINIVLAWPLLKAVEQDSTHEDVPWVNEEYNYKYPFPSIANIAISFYQHNGPIWKCSSITWSYIHLIGLCAWSLPPFQVTPRFKCGS